MGVWEGSSVRVEVEGSSVGVWAVKDIQCSSLEFEPVY